MRAVFHLLAGDLGGLFPLLFSDQFLEGARADDVSALADDQRAVAFLGFDQIDAGIVRAMCRKFRLARLLAFGHLGDGVDVGSGGAAATAHQIQPAVIGEAIQLLGQRLRGLEIFAVFVRQPGIRVARDPHRCHLAERADVVRHELRTGGAIQADRKKVDVRNGTQECVGGLAGEHRAHRLDGPGDHYRNLAAQLAHDTLDSEQPGFHVARVLAGFEHQDIGAAFHQRLGLFVIIFFELRGT